MKLAAFALAAVSLGAVHAGAASPPLPGPQRIAVDARGPLALVEVTRAVLPERAEGAGGNEALLDLALPEGAALVSVEVRDGARWRSVDPATDGGPRADDAYRAESAARVTGCGLDEETLEGTFLQQTRICDAVQRHSTCHAKVLGGGALEEILNLLQQNFFQGLLQAGCNVIVK